MVVDGIVQALVSGLVGGVMTGVVAFTVMRVEVSALRRDVERLYRRSHEH